MYLESTDSSGRTDPFRIVPETVRTSREAWYAAKKSVPLEQAAGMVAGESVIPYPPGIPVLYPGERITKDVLACLQSVRRAGYPLHGPDDPTMDRLLVLSE